MKTAPILLLIALFSVSCASSNGHRKPNYGMFIQGLNQQYNQGIQQHRDTVRFHERNNAQKIQIQNTGYGRAPVNLQQNACDLRCQHTRQMMIQKLYFGQ